MSDPILLDVESLYFRKEVEPVRIGISDLAAAGYELGFVEDVRDLGTWLHVDHESIDWLRKRQGSAWVIYWHQTRPHSKTVYDLPIFDPKLAMLFKLTWL